MKQIVKNDTGTIQPQIDSWVTKARRKEEADWGHFAQDKTDSGAHAPTKAALIGEQGHICCYCERRISAGSYHVEHFKGRARHPEFMFYYTNLHASCNGSPGTTDRCCGHKRTDQGNPDIPISPLDEKCESRFCFTGYGQIRPSEDDDQEARQTIATVGLDSPKLRGMRRAIMHALTGCYKGMEPDEFRDYVEQKLQRDESTRFPSFFTTIRQFADELLGVG